MAGEGHASSTLLVHVGGVGAQQAHQLARSRQSRLHSSQDPLDAANGSAERLDWHTPWSTRRWGSGLPRRWGRRLIVLSVLFCTLSLASAGTALGQDSAPPANDDFANATTVNSRRPISGTLAASTFQDGEPLPACVADGTHASVWYQYSARRLDDFVTVRLRTAIPSSRIAFWQGDSLGTLRELDCIGTQVKLRPRAKGERIYIQVLGRQEDLAAGVRFDPAIVVRATETRATTRAVTSVIAAWFLGRC